MSSPHSQLPDRGLRLVPLSERRAPVIRQRARWPRTALRARAALALVFFAAGVSAGWLIWR